MSEKILITSALPYANGPLHFGHIAGAYLPADCYARFERLQGKDVLFICGSDEHGVAITLNAQLAGRSPKEHVDIYHKVIQDFFKELNISFDHYSRTTWEKHAEFTQHFFRDLKTNGFIEERITPQLYSEKEKMFLADRYVVGTCPKCKYDQARGDECPRCASSFEATDLLNPRSKLSNAPLITKETKHWFLRFDLFKDRLDIWLAEKKWKPSVINFAKKYVEDLRPRAITRDSDWGIPVPLPEANGKVFYVWFDAPIGYISATSEWAEKKGDPEAWKQYWLDPKTKLVQFIGKDNIPFHAVFFPAMTMGQNQPYNLVDELPANEFYNLEGKQFSKSDGWYIDLADFFQHCTADQIRYAIAANAPENQDSEFSWKDFQLRCNSELLGKYGNLVNRVLVFAKNNCQGVIPELGKLDLDGQDFLDKMRMIADQIQNAYKGFHLRLASQLVMELAQLGNVYFDRKKPWLAKKDPSLHSDMMLTISLCLECIKILAITSFPIIPTSASKVWLLLGYQIPLEAQIWDVAIDKINPAGQKLAEPVVLFQRIEDEWIQTQMNNLHEKSSATKNYAPLKSTISFEEASKLDLRVGEILEVEKVPKSKKLLKLLVDVGFEKRTIVSGIAHGIEDPLSLIGKKVVVVANLSPATIMGIESQGMLLAADASGKFVLPETSTAQPGDVIS